MAKVNLTLPNLDLDNLNDSQIIRKIASYLYIQNEQLRYELTHIDEDNMSSEESTSVQGMTQDQIRKAIEEAIRQNKDIDLSSNTVIVNMQRKMDNLAKLQAQDASNITRITQELGNKVSMTTYNAGLSGLKRLIEGNNTLIGGLNQNLGLLSTAYYAHKHQITINDTTGVISIGGPTASVTNPNISATLFFQQKVAEADRNARPRDIESLTIDSEFWTGIATVVCNDDKEVNLRITIDARSVLANEYDSGWNDCIDAASGAEYLSGYTNYGNATLYDSHGGNVGTHYWRYGGSTVTRYTLPDKR